MWSLYKASTWFIASFIFCLVPASKVHSFSVIFRAVCQATDENVYLCLWHRYVVLKDSFVAYLRPDEGTISDVLLMDQDFSVKAGVKETGVRKGLLISNLSRFHHVTDYFSRHRHPHQRGLSACWSNCLFPLLALHQSTLYSVNNPLSDWSVNCHSVSVYVWTVGTFSL